MLHQLQHCAEPLEVEFLGGSEWTFFEERHDTLHEVDPTLHTEATERLAMVVVAMLLDHDTAPEHLDEEFEHGDRPERLNDGELMLDLPAESTRRIPDDRDRKASLAVDEADGPLLSTWPFLLIVRTERIFTAHDHTLRTGCDNERVPNGYSGFPAYGRLHCPESLLAGATPLAEGETLGPL